MAKINLSTLAANAARLKKAITTREEKLRDLTGQIISRVGTGGRTIQTSLGQVIVSQQTESRPGSGFNIQFDQAKYLELDAAIQALLLKTGVININPQVIQGRQPVVSFRLNKES